MWLLEMLMMVQAQQVFIRLSPIFSSSPLDLLLFPP